eukprot:3934792-Rhodomonas_salina.3
MDDWGETARSLSDDRTVDLPVSYCFDAAELGWSRRCFSLMEWCGQTGIFFVSFVILVGIVILNVVVAVLLDEFVESVTEDREQRIQDLLSKRQVSLRCAGACLSTQKLKQRHDGTRSGRRPTDPRSTHFSTASLTTTPRSTFLRGSAVFARSAMMHARGCACAVY